MVKNVWNFGSLLLLQWISCYGQLNTAAMWLVYKEALRLHGTNIKSINNYSNIAGENVAVQLYCECCLSQCYTIHIMSAAFYTLLKATQLPKGKERVYTVYSVCPAFIVSKSLRMIQTTLEGRQTRFETLNRFIKVPGLSYNVTNEPSSGNCTFYFEIHYYDIQFSIKEVQS